MVFRDMFIHKVWGDDSGIQFVDMYVILQSDYGVRQIQELIVTPKELQAYSSLMKDSLGISNFQLLYTNGKVKILVDSTVEIFDIDDMSDEEKKYISHGNLQRTIDVGYTGVDALIWLQEVGAVLTIPIFESDIRGVHGGNGKGGRNGDMGSYVEVPLKVSEAFKPSEPFKTNYFLCEKDTQGMKAKEAATWEREMEPEASAEENEEARSKGAPVALIDIPLTDLDIDTEGANIKATYFYKSESTPVTVATYASGILKFGKNYFRATREQFERIKRNPNLFVRELDKYKELAEEGGTGDVVFEVDFDVMQNSIISAQYLQFLPQLVSMYTVQMEHMQAKLDALNIIHYLVRRESGSLIPKQIKYPGLRECEACEGSRRVRGEGIRDNESGEYGSDEAYRMLKVCTKFPRTSEISISDLDKLTDAEFEDYLYRIKTYGYRPSSDNYFNQVFAKEINATLNKNSEMSIQYMRECKSNIFRVKASIYRDMYSYLYEMPTSSWRPVNTLIGQVKLILGGI